MKKIVCEMLEQQIKQLYGIKVSKIRKNVELPLDAKMGDFSLPCFEIAKILKKNPGKIAEELKQAIEEGNYVKWLAGAESVNGYLNLFINRQYYIRMVIEEAADTDYGCTKEGDGKTICMDYSSPNIAKNFHVGHLRTTVIGNSLYKILTKAGYRVVRINHLGDWGTQFGKLIAAYKLWSSPESVREGGIEELLRIYVKFGDEAKKDPKLDDEAREWFAKMEQGNEEALDIWKWFKEISLKEFERVYEILHVQFDSYQGESFYRDKIPELVEELKAKNLLKESDGANIIELDKYGMPPCLIIKKDGSSIYHSRDIAAAIYRKKTYDFSSCLYITGMEQKLHFLQIFKALELMGYEWAEECHHILYGLVSIGGETLSTRRGNTVYAEDILAEAVTRAKAAIGEKNPVLPDQEDIARKIGVGAVIFHDLANQLSRDVAFDWNTVLNFDGMTAPYIQYTFARANSIIRKGGKVASDIEVEYLTDDVSYELIKQIGRYGEAVSEAAEKYEPCVIARYAYRVAVLFNRFYQECRILNTEDKVKEARVALTYITQKVIGDAMGLLGVECPGEM